MNFPFEVKNVTDEEDRLLKKHYKGYIRKFVRAGPSGYLSPPGYADHAADICNLEPRPDDIWVVTFSRSGTTWLQELVWLVANDMDFEVAKNTSLTKRFAYIEYPTQEFEVRKEPRDPNGPRATYEDFRTLSGLPSPRYVKTHLPLSLLPPKLLDTSKVFYVARDPRDVAVSFYFMHKLFRYFVEGTTFKDFWELFKRDLVLHMPIFAHVEEAWRQRSHPNLMFVFYEDMQKNLLSVIDQVCTFLGRQYPLEVRQQLVQYLSFDNMKATTSFTTNKDEQTEVKFIRKGQSGNWVQYFDDEMKVEAEEYMEKHLKKTDLRYPDFKK